MSDIKVTVTFPNGTTATSTFLPEEVAEKITGIPAEWFEVDEAAEEIIAEALEDDDAHAAFVADGGDEDVDLGDDKPAQRFKVGDRVEYDGSDGGVHARYTEGDRGTVTATSPLYVSVKFADGGRQWIDREHLSHVDEGAEPLQKGAEPLQEGDRVVVTSERPGTKAEEGSGYVVPSLTAGMIGTVTVAAFDGGAPVIHFPDIERSQYVHHAHLARVIDKEAESGDRVIRTGPHRACYGFDFGDRECKVGSIGRVLPRPAWYDDDDHEVPVTWEAEYAEGERTSVIEASSLTVISA